MKEYIICNDIKIKPCYVCQNTKNYLQIEDCYLYSYIFDLRDHEDKKILIKEYVKEIRSYSNIKIDYMFYFREAIIYDCPEHIDYLDKLILLM
jgi:hypothetical protein